jgi:hypothetical protein
VWIVCQIRYHSILILPIAVDFVSLREMVLPLLWRIGRGTDGKDPPRRLTPVCSSSFPTAEDSHAGFGRHRLYSMRLQVPLELRPLTEIGRLTNSIRHPVTSEDIFRQKDRGSRPVYHIAEDRPDGAILPVAEPVLAKAPQLTPSFAPLHLFTSGSLKSAPVPRLEAQRESDRPSNGDRAVL